MFRYPDPESHPDPEFHCLATFHRRSESQRHPVVKPQVDHSSLVDQVLAARALEAIFQADSVRSLSNISGLFG